MPGVPTLLSQESAQARSPTLIAQGSDFDAGFTVARGLGATAAGVADIASAVNRDRIRQAEIEKQKKRTDDIRWSHEASFQLRRYLNEWMADPQVNTAEDFGERFRKTADQEMGKYVQKAPSPEAEMMFRERMDSFLLTKEDYALDLGMKTRISNTIESFSKQTQDALMSFRTAKTLPGSNAVQQLVSDLDTLRVAVKEAFALTPKLSNTIIAEIESQFVNEAMIANPDLAQALLDESTQLSGEQRRILSSLITSHKDTRNTQEITAFENMRDDALANAEAGVPDDRLIQQPPKDQYVQIYGEDRGIAMYERDKARFAVAYRVSDWKDTAGKLNPASLRDAFQKLMSGAKDAIDWAVVAEAQRFVKDTLRLQTEDPVKWIYAENPEVAALVKKLQTTTNDNDRVALLGDINDAILRYQGPIQDNKGLWEWYLDNPINDQHLTTIDQAEEFASQVNNSPPEGVLDAFAKIFAQYPKTEHQIIVLNDMVTLPPEGKGIRPEYQLILQNKNAHWLDTFIGSIQQGDSVKKLSTETYNKVENAMDSNATWLAFQRSMAGDNLQRLKEVDSWRSAIMTYANAISLQQGYDPETSVDMALDRLVNETLGFAYVNGHPMAIPRDRGNDQPERTDDEIYMLGRRLAVYLENFPATAVDPKNPAFVAMSTLEGEEQTKAIHDYVVSNGFWQTSPDGQGAILYLNEPEGFMFQLVDKKGKPFSIDFEDLPEIPEIVFPLSIFGGKIRVPVNLSSKAINKILKRQGLINTNWPSR